MPINPVMNGGINAPLEGDDEPGMSGFRFAVRAASDRALGWTALTKLQGDTEGGPVVSQADAVAALKGENYDTTGVPAEGMTQGALQARMSRASDIRQSEDIAGRARLGTTSQVVAGIAGAVGDPLNIVLAPLAPLTGVRVGLAGRAAIGAAEGAVVTGAYEKGQNALGKSMGDPDITSQQMLRDMMFGGALGGVMHSAFGPRPVAAPGGGPVTLDMIDRLGERTGNYSKATGIPADQAVSRAGALGRYQVEPATAAQMMGLDGKNQATLAAMRLRLRDPAFNKEMAGKYLDTLNKQFPNDPEAVAIAYNAGPGTARKFVRSGRDYGVLPQETREYAARVAGMPRNVRIDAAKMATAQMETDSAVNVKPVIDGGMAEHFQVKDVSEPGELERAAPKRDSLFTENKETNDAISRVDDVSNRSNVDTAGDLPVGEVQNAIDPELAEHVTNDMQDAKDIHERLGNVVQAFHGTNADFKDYDVAQSGKFGAADSHGAIFFTSNPEIASSYAKFAAKTPKIETRDTPAEGFEPVVGADGKTKYVKAAMEDTFEGANVRPVKLSFQNAKEVDMKGATYSQRVFGNAIAQAKAAGHDGVIFRNVNDDVGGSKTSTVYASFNPKEATTPHFGEFEPPEMPKIDGLAADEHQKAVEAAVRCGLLKGGFE